MSSTDALAQALRGRFDIIRAAASTPLLLNIPHSSDFVPQECRTSFVLSDSELCDEHARIVDWYTDELFAPAQQQCGALALVSRLSRLVCDPERFEDDRQEAMSARGVGVIYEKTTLQTPLRIRPDPTEREVILSSFYRPYHAALHDATQQMLRHFGSCVLFDCHSFPARSLPYELVSDAYRPDICIGTDRVHTPAWLVQIVERAAQRAEFSVALNTPFAGTIVPLPLYGERNVMSLMIEINRACYMDEATTKKHQGFTRVQQWIGSVASEVIATLNSQG